jgi:hypothetical protein
VVVSVALEPSGERRWDVAHVASGAGEERWSDPRRKPLLSRLFAE